MLWNIQSGILPHVSTNQTLRKENRPAPGVGLFSTPSGIRAVQSPARAQILAVLAGRDLPFDEIVRPSGKAKSTVSVHLQVLEREGIIAGKADPANSRKKIFCLRSQHLGNLASAKPVIRDNNSEILTG